MQIVLQQSDFQDLPREVQDLILERLLGRHVTERAPEPMAVKARWREPLTLTPELAAKFVHGLSPGYRKRLALFATRKGRVSVKEIQQATGDPDLKATSDFQKAMTRRLRRYIHDPEKKAQLIGWDFNATKWDEKRTSIVDGVYYVSHGTAAALRQVLDVGEDAVNA